MHRTQSYQSKDKRLKRRKAFVSSVKGVSHLSRRTKRRLYCKLQLWMWRKRRERCRLGIASGKKLANGVAINIKTQARRNKGKVPPYHANLQHSQAGASVLVSPLVRDMDVALAPASRSTSTAAASQRTLEVSRTVKPPLSTDTARLTKPTTARQSLEVTGAAGRHIPTSQDQAAVRDPDETSSNKTASSQIDAGLTVLTNHIHEFLNDFYRIYGSFIPLQKSDVLRQLKMTFNADFKECKSLVLSEVTKYRAAMVQRPIPSFQVVYKKHTLTLDDLSTLADQNWLNDQVMNMYGELIMESAHHKVHFLNSFFHRQLMTKGYEGVKRWTKQVDLFSKVLLLVPVHLEVHWCLVAADMVRKKICLLDSQGNALLKVARNILKYLMTEAKEKQRAAFESGWTVSFDKDIPQQTNENDCGVFVLEYSRCLALAQPLQFSQKDVPKIRKRIYKELCDCKLREQG